MIYFLGHENFKIWAQEDRVPELEYAASIGPKVIEYYEKLFDYPFPLEKMDMVAIPDFRVNPLSILVILKLYVYLIF